jgi:hypothetical protein
MSKGAIAALKVHRRADSNAAVLGSTRKRTSGCGFFVFGRRGTKKRETTGERIDRATRTQQGQRPQ